MSSKNPTIKVGFFHSSHTILLFVLDKEGEQRANLKGRLCLASAEGNLGVLSEINIQNTTGSGSRLLT
jgi:hypothetical protein